MTIGQDPSKKISQHPIKPWREDVIGNSDTDPNPDPNPDPSTCSIYEFIPFPSYSMLIGFEEISRILSEHNLTIHGSFHIGAHECEELAFYHKLGLSSNQVVWIDANPVKVEEAVRRGVPNVYHGVVTDKDDEEIIFNISNNGQSSSVLEFGTHSIEHPSVTYVDKLHQKSITIDTFFKRHSLDAANYDF